MKSVLSVSEESRISAENLFAEAMKVHTALTSFDKGELESFRWTRNRIVHYGFSPRDDEETAVLLLKTGLRFTILCYREFFNFDLLTGLAAEFGQHLGIALDVYQRAKGIPGLQLSYCFLAFGKLVRWSVRESLMAD